MQATEVRKITIVGGGTAGWMAAAALSQRYRNHDLNIELIESDAIGTVGVGEATVPGIIHFHNKLGIPEREFVKATNATFKLGIEFVDWRKPDTRFFHPFAAFGAPIAGRDFYQCWLKLHRAGIYHDLEDFCLPVAMARQNRFAQPDDQVTNPLGLYSYAYHFDATRYAQYLKEYALERAVKRTEGRIVQVDLDPKDGFIEKVRLESGETIGGDLFVDCSGFRGLLIEQALNTGFEDWARWLPCDRAVAVQSERMAEPKPYTQSIAREYGWQWRIPLQNRTGNGYVYCSEYLDEDGAQEVLLNNLEGRPTTEPRVVRFRAGVRKQFWNKNCVALGLASGFLEPLESTSISLIKTGIEKMMQFMPELRVTDEAVAEANRLNQVEYERIRDFIILHYKSTQRGDSPFWRYVRDMEVPRSLEQKIEMFKHDGSVQLGEQESFLEPSWIAMYNGFLQIPQSTNSAVFGVDDEQLNAVFCRMKAAIEKAAACAPRHWEFLRTV